MNDDINPYVDWPDGPIYEAYLLRCEQQISEAGTMLAEHRIVVSEKKPEYPIYHMLHPSTTIPGGWQVTHYDKFGPFGHFEDETMAAVLTGTFEDFSPEDLRPVSESEFMELTRTPKFQAGVERNTYIALVNEVGRQFGNSTEARAALQLASRQPDLRSGIDVLLATLERLREE